jgi:threonine dehydrogenase-like Zn-dependent dehydrogenase
LPKKCGYGSILLATLLLAAAIPALSTDDRKAETIDATAMGTSTQMGKTVSVKVTIYQFSTQEDRQVLMDAFHKGKNQGLVDALTKVKAVGRIAISGTLGYDLSYIALIRLPTGRKIRFAANRQIRFGEVYNNSRSMDYNLTAGQIDLNDSDKSKSSGVLYPASRLIINKRASFSLSFAKNPWKLVNIIDWNGGAKE